MRNKIVITMAGLFLLAGCGIVGGPSDAKIEELARQQMAASAPSPELQAVAKDAKISKRGLCNTQAEPGTYVCMVDVTAKMPGAPAEATQTMIVKVKKGANGDWVATD